jgi:hypothetical protein
MRPHPKKMPTAAANPAEAAMIQGLIIAGMPARDPATV